MYAYCNNNPVNFIDPNGEIFVWFAVAVLIVVTPLILSSCGTRTLLEDTAYETYEEALEVANERVYNSGFSHSEERDKKMLFRLMVLNISVIFTTIHQMKCFI